MFKLYFIFLLTYSWCEVTSFSVTFDENTTLHEYDVCNGRPYSLCRKIKDCPFAEKDIESEKRPKTCSFEGKEPLVCCRFDGSSTEISGAQSRKNSDLSDDWDEDEKTMSVKKCIEYGKLICRPLVVPYVYGGVKAKPRELPHMALIGFGPENDKTWQCGGSVISTRYILSAAHCTNISIKVGPARWVLLGDLDYNKTSDDSKPQLFTIIERINHPDYKTPELYNDIALYKVDKEIIFNSYVRPICLHPRYSISSRKGKAAGWGRTEFVGPTSYHLLYANINLIEPELCRNNLQNRLSTNTFPDGIKTDSIVCAGEADGSKDTCQGDSGGPLFVSQESPWPPCLFRQVGVTSSGLQCALENTPGIYTRVSKYIPWIESIVWEKDP